MKPRIFITGAIALAFLPAAASAATTEVVYVHPRAQNTVQLGGGLNTYTAGFDNITDTGAAYDLRVAFGLRNPIGFELGFAGALNDLKSASAIGVSGTSTSGNRLMSDAGEALVRLNLGGAGDIIPYVGAGVGVTDTRIVDDSFNTVSVESGGGGTTPSGAPRYAGSSTDFHVPAAAGVDAIINDRVTLGARASYKYDFRNGLRTDVAKADVQSWQATARLGLAF